ncbi:sericin-2-like [Macrobrachium rosenbergii]|uniref:sericin-2-like n=1 Tax=Macrobrachium rosenbergii TaxID=79674 RepID=UPI0034D6C05F
MPMPYDFAYGVNGGEFGDIKAHKEVTSVDGRTEGEYRWLQPNGLYIVTRYFVDGDSGYQATVSEEAGPEVTNFYSNSQDEQISTAQQSVDSQQTLTSQQNFNNQQSQTSQQTFSRQVTSNQQSQSSSASSVQGSAGLIVTSQAANLGGVSSLENSQQSSAFVESGATSSSQQLSTGFSQVNTESQSGSTDLRQGAALSSVSQSVSAGSQSVSSGSNELDQITTVAQILVRPAVIAFTNEASALNNVGGSRVTETSQSGADSLSSSTASSSSSQSATSGSSTFTQSSSAGLISGSVGATQSSSVGVSAESSLTGGSSQSALLSQSQNSRNRATSSAASSSSSFSSNQQSSSSFSSNQQSSSFNQQSGAAVLAGDVKSIAVILAGSPEAANLRKN